MTHPTSVLLQPTEKSELAQQFGMIVALLILASLSVWFARNSAIHGDGAEYLGMSASLVNHRSPDLRKGDVYELLDNRALLEITRGYMSRLTPLVDEGKDGVDYGYFRATNGAFYSYHFWLYPAVNVPALAIANWLKIDPGNSFLMTNALFLVLASLLVVRTTHYSIVQRWTLMALIWLGGSSYYVGWSGPEVFTFSLLIMSGVALKERSFTFAAFCLAVAAQQNPPIGLLSVAVLLLTIPGLWERRRHPAQLVAGLAKVALVGLTLILSPAFYFFHFGAPSLIARTGQASASNISAERFVSFFLDLNQGMIIGVPGLFVASAVSFLYFTRRGRLRDLPFGLLVLVTLCTIVLVIPCLATINLNPGSNGMIRYALWSAVPAGFGLVELIGHMASVSWQLVTAFSLLLPQIALIVLNGSPFDGGGYLEFKPTAKFVLGHFPRFYSPVPEVFVSRGTHRDGGANSANTYFYVQHGYITRILFDRSAGPLWLPACPEFSPSLPPVPPGRSGWTYATPARGNCPSDMSTGLHVVRRGLQGDIPPILDNAQHVKVWKACDLPSLVGSVTRSCNRIAKSGIDSPGHLVFGPYVHLPAGNYRVTFKVRTGGSAAGQWEIPANGRGMIVSGDFDDTHGEFASVTVPLRVPPHMDNDVFEFRAYFTGHAQLEVQSITLQQLIPGI